MKRYFRTVAAIFVANLSWPVAANTLSPGYVTQIATMQSGVVIFQLSGAETNVPSCNTLGRYTINATTAAGQARLSSLLTAAAGHKVLTVTTTGTCPDWPDSEGVDYFWVTY